MSELDARLGKLLEGRKQKGRFRSLKEYDTTQLSDFVSCRTSHQAIASENP